MGLFSIFKYTFLLNAIIISVLASFACGITGSFIVKKKMTFVTGGIAHAVLGGIGIAYFFKFNTLAGTLIFAFIFCLIITLAKIYAGQEENTLISVLWAVGMSIGIIFMYLTPGYNVDMMSFVFGNILLIEKIDILTVLIMDCIIITTTFVLYKHFLYVSFDENFLKIRGLMVNVIYFLLLFLIAITVVILIKVVGLILVIALLTLPAVISSFFTKKMLFMILGAIILGMIFTVSGVIISFYLNLPSSACIIIFSGIIYLFSVLIKKIIFNR